MKVQVKIDPAISEKEVTITSPVQDEELSRLCKVIEQWEHKIPLFDEDGCMHLFYAFDITRIYSMDKHVYASMNGACYRIRMRLYEAEETLSFSSFVRISHHELINLYQVQRFDFTYTNTIVILMKDGAKCYASRRYIRRIKEQLERMGHL